MILTMTNRNGNDWHVWAQLEGGDPTDRAESFVIGSGDTAELAKVDARRTLHAALDQLALGHALREYEVIL